MIDIAKIKERLSKITPPPWDGHPSINPTDWVVEASHPPQQIAHVNAVYVAVYDSERSVGEEPNEVETAANGEFIASAPSDIAALLAEVEKRDKTIALQGKVIEAAKAVRGYAFHPLDDDAPDNEIWTVVTKHMSNLNTALAELDKEVSDGQET